MSPPCTGSECKTGGARRFTRAGVGLRRTREFWDYEPRVGEASTLEELRRATEQHSLLFSLVQAECLPSELTSSVVARDIGGFGGINPSSLD